MAKTKGGTSKKSAPKKLAKKRGVYDCNDVEEYLDRAIERVKDEIVPKIDAIDERDKTQYDMAKNIMKDAALAAQGRQEAIQAKVDLVGKELQEIYESRKQMVNQLTTSFESLHERFEELHEKLDMHITDETSEFKEIHSKMSSIQDTLDNVSANGNKGLSNSMRDIHDKIAEVEKATVGIRARARFYSSVANVVETTAFLKPLKHKWGVVFYAALLLLVINTVLHTLGVEWDLLGIFRWAVGLLNK